MPLQATSGAASYDGFGGGVVAEPNYIESCFSTYLYTGNDSTQTITNGIDLSGKGGLTWIKSRNEAFAHRLFDTARGANYFLISNTTDASTYDASSLTSFNSTGFSLGSEYRVNAANTTYASWTFREQPKFFDVVTYTGTQGVGGSGQAISHNLGSEPACIIIKPINDSGTNWTVYHRGLSSPFTQQLLLNSTAAVATNSNKVKAVSSTTFTAGWELAFDTVQYVAYVFAHNAGGFGLTGTDNVISCGSYSGTGSDMSVTLGYEPQYVMIKRTDSTGDWWIGDTMRGFNLQGVARLEANTSDAEAAIYNGVQPTATGFFLPAGTVLNGGGDTFIYIAIRRGPMKVPTVGTSVFSPNRWTSTVGSAITTNFPLDFQISKWMGTGGDGNFVQDRLRGLNTVTTNSAQPYLFTESTAAESTNSGANYNFGNTGFLVGDNNSGNGWAINFRRAPSFFDEVCWTGNNGANQRVSHNLGVVPELIIYKGRNKVNYWRVYFGSINTYIQLDAGIAAVSGSNFWGSLAPTTTDFGINCGSMDLDNFNAVGYLFATCPGVSKVGSYTGTGATQTINCGFGASGSRFVLIKRTDSTGDWYVWDSARGMVSGTDPSLLLNSTAAEVNANSVYAVSTGFQIVSTAAGINASGGSYIFLSVA
jgi:hypothetical protein